MALVSRAGNKLSEAASAFSYDFRGKTVLDIGSSTGGFTEYALKKGASKVFAIEKGPNQLAMRLKGNPKVELHEKTDIFEVISEKKNNSLNLQNNVDGRLTQKLIIDVPDVILADVSFVSLKKVLLYVRNNIAGAKTDFLVMLKPQFEAKDSQLNRGVVKNEKMRRDIVKDFEFWLKKSGFLMVKKHDNELTGKNGNRERFYLLKISDNFLDTRNA